jgi:hypothetical protein
MREDQKERWRRSFIVSRSIICLILTARTLDIAWSTG